MTPFQAVYGRTPPALIYYGDRETPNSMLDEQLKERDVALGYFEGAFANSSRKDEELCRYEEKTCRI